MISHLDDHPREISGSENCVKEQTKKDILQKLSFFEEFSEEETYLVLKITDWIKFSPGDYIVKEGDIDRMFFLILKGSVVVKKYTGIGGYQQILRRLTTGQSFGEMSFITSGPRSAGIVSAEETYILRFNAEVLDQEQSNPQYAPLLNKFYKKFSQILANWLTEASKELTNPCSRLF